MKFRGLILVFAAGGLLVGCTTIERSQPRPRPRPEQGSQIAPDAVRTIPRKKVRVNIGKLTQVLRMERSYDSLGYEEKRFNTCKVGSGYPSDSNCQTHYLVTIHFHFQCRDSTGTVEQVVNLMPFSSRRLEWKVGLFKGFVKTDREGFGQIRFVSPGSSKGQSLRLVDRPNSLRLGASGVRRIVTPRDWCIR